MITDIAAFLKYFDGVNRRAMRDIGSLPEAAESWKPPGGEGEGAWDIGELVGHMAASRLFFASAYRNEGWVAERWAEPTRTREQWLAALEGSAGRLRERLDGTPTDWLSRRVESLDSPDQTIAGWRLLMMMTEHDIHHRSQIDSYAGIMGWPVQQIFGRKAESIWGAQHPEG